MSANQGHTASFDDMKQLVSPRLDLLEVKDDALAQAFKDMRSTVQAAGISIEPAISNAVQLDGNIHNPESGNLKVVSHG